MRKYFLKRIVWLLADVLLMTLSMEIGSLLLGRTAHQEAWWAVVIIIAVRCALFLHWRLYRAVLRFSGIHTVIHIALACAVGSIAGAGFAFALSLDDFGGLGRAFLLLEFLLSCVFLVSTRLAVRSYFRWKQARSSGGAVRVCLFGAGFLGEMMLRNLQNDGFSVVGFFDDNKKLKGSVIHGRRVFGSPEDMAEVQSRMSFDVLAVAIRDLSQPRLKAVFHVCMELGIRMKVVHGVDRIIDGSSAITVEDLSMEDLLHRPKRELDRSLVTQMLSGKVVLVTGAGGSIGSEICRQVVAAHVSKIILLDHSEYNLYAIDQELRVVAPAGVEIKPVLMSLRYKDALDRLFAREKPQVVYHAAAYKHVPLVEGNPLVGLLNNISGLYHLLACVQAHGVQKLVHISTDKAVRPTNVMGASKRVCELLLQNFPLGHVHACAVRFGNVLGSSGSVIPHFVKQINAGGPVTVTDPEMTRYFMLIPEAVELVLQSGALADKGEIFILDMGRPVKIVDLARQLIYAAGHIPDKDIEITFTGLRPGEKMYEELIIDDAEGGTAIEGIMRAKPLAVDWEELSRNVESLFTACREGHTDKALAALRTIVPEWTTPVL